MKHNYKILSFKGLLKGDWGLFELAENGLYYHPNSAPTGFTLSEILSEILSGRNRRVITIYEVVRLWDMQHFTIGDLINSYMGRATIQSIEYISSEVLRLNLSYPETTPDYKRFNSILIGNAQSVEPQQPKAAPEKEKLTWKIQSFREVSNSIASRSRVAFIGNDSYFHLEGQKFTLNALLSNSHWEIYTVLRSDGAQFSLGDTNLKDYGYKTNPSTSAKIQKILWNKGEPTFWVADLWEISSKDIAKGRN